VSFPDGKGGKRPALIKSKKARDYERDALLQIPPAARVQLEGPLRVTLRVFYASQRPDLDESVILDVLQDRYTGKGERRELVQKGVYRNDRQVREKHVFHAIDRANPRAEVEVEALEAQQDRAAARPCACPLFRRARRRGVAILRGDSNGYRDVNKPRAYRSDPTCKGKQRYIDEVGVRAYGAITMVERKNTARLWCYRCTHCGGWHLTSNNQGPRWEIKAHDPAPRAGHFVKGWRA
jgi:Holliday junction resolvase RusA-like endonuclease